MAGSFIQLPSNVDDSIQLRRFLDKLVQQLDIAFGNRGDDAFVTQNSFISGVNSIQELVNAINKELLTYSKLDGSRDYTGKVSYDSTKSFTSGSNEIVDVAYVEGYSEPIFTKNTAFNKDFGTTSGTVKEGFTENTAFNKNFGTTSGTVTEGGTTTNNPKQASISPLNQTISNPPTQTEVQAISDKVDAILTALQSSNIIT